MKISIVFLAAIFIFGLNQSKAQEEPDRFTAEAQKDPAYIKFRGQLNALVGSTRGKPTNIAAVKNLFIANKSLFTKLYLKGGLPASEGSSSGPRKQASINPGTIFQLGKTTKPFSELTFTKTSAYDWSWRGTAFPNVNMSPPPFDTTGTSKATGKIVLTSNPCQSVNYCYLGTYRHGFMERITVPSNNQILAARVKFEYSLTYDAWDSYNAKMGIDLIFRASSNFTSSAYAQFPDASQFYFYPTDRWKVIGNLFPLDTITTDFGEYHAALTSSFTIEGYVTPGSDLDFHFGLGFPLGTNRGLTGCYHYGEFKLKKITVTYLKTME